MQQTHYDTLKVSRDAPIEVIRAAYRALSQKYHPDRHPADCAADETMGLLNKAYEVLSDPERRHAHDAWIRQSEAESSQVRTYKAKASPPARVDLEEEIGSDVALMARTALHLRQFGMLYGSVLLVVVSLVVVRSLAPGPQTNSWVAPTPAPEDREAYIRQIAREVMLRHGDGTKGYADVPTTADTAASPSDDAPASATKPETPPERVEARSDDDPTRPNDTARPATHPREEARATPELPSVSPPNEAELPSVPQPKELSQPNEEAADPATSSFESHQDSTEAVVGTE